MRVRFEWIADEPLELPINYNQILQGIIYNNMEGTYGYSEFVHENGYTLGKRHFKMFCYSGIFGKARVHNKRIAFTGQVAFEVSSPEVFLIRTLAQNVEKNGLCFGNKRYMDITVLISDYEVETEQIMVRAMSPIVVYMTDADTKMTRYCYPGEWEFECLVNDNFYRKYMAYYGIPPRSDIELVPMHVSERDKCVTTYKGFYITGYRGIYQLIGERQYLNFLYQTGVGARNSQGFGMIEEVE